MTATLDYRPVVTSAADVIAATLAAHGVRADVADPVTGPTTRTYGLELARGTRPEELDRLTRSLAVALQVDAVRLTTRWGRLALEVPREDREAVPLPTLPDDASPTSWPVGIDTAGEVVLADLAAAPHVLIAGTTGAGKSTAVHALLRTLTDRTSQTQTRLLLIDVKRVELAAYAATPNAVGEVATDVDAAADALRWAVAEMGRRYESLERHGVRSVDDLPTGSVPRLVVVVDELADLMLQARKVCEPLLVRLAQLGRAAGVHLVLATQRPSADVLTGLIRANVPSRLVLAVLSHVDSGVALGMSGAETLTGRGDALWLPAGARQPVRLQVPLTDAPRVTPVDHTSTYDAPTAHAITGLVISTRDGETAEPSAALLARQRDRYARALASYERVLAAHAAVSSANTHEWVQVAYAEALSTYNLIGTEHERVCLFCKIRPALAGFQVCVDPGCTDPTY